MDNNFGGFGQGQFPNYGNEPPNAQAPSFEQMNQEFFQGQGQQPQYQQPFQDQGFGQQPFQDQGFGQQPHTPPQGWANQGQAPTDPFGHSSTPTPFGQEAYPFGGTGAQSSYSDDQEMKWWQKGARVFLIGGAGILLLAILIFVIATNLNKRSVEKPPVTPNNQQLEQSQDELPEVEQPVQQPQTPEVQEPDPTKWQEIGNTDGYNFVETRIGEFIVKDLALYYKNDGGLQVRSAAVGTLEGYPGIYEVDLPRTAALFDKVTLGYKFKVSFDVYKAADSSGIFIENIRPDK